jgi:hypothetical protein
VERPSIDAVILRGAGSSRATEADRAALIAFLRSL